MRERRLCWATGLGTQRAGPERVLDVGENQFLMLLLVVEAEFNQREHFVAGMVQQRKHGGVDMRPIGVHPLQAGARHQPARSAIGMRTELLVVGVEQVLEVGIESPISGQSVAAE